jgi:hypothetical protein
MAKTWGTIGASSPRVGCQYWSSMSLGWRVPREHLSALWTNAPDARLPGTGMVTPARRLTTTLLAMTFAEALETTRIHRVAGLTGNRPAFVITRWRHTSTTLPAQP